MYNLNCSRSQGRHLRHKAINKIIHNALNKAKIPNILEPTNLSLQDGLRPDESQSSYQSQPQSYNPQPQSYNLQPQSYQSSYGFKHGGSGKKESGVKGTISDCLAGKLKCNFKVLKIKSSGEDSTTNEPSTSTSAPTTTTAEATTDAFYYYKESIKKGGKGGYSNKGGIRDREYKKSGYSKTGKNSTETTEASVITTEADVEKGDVDVKEWVLRKNIKGGKVYIKKISKSHFEKDKKKRKRKNKKNKKSRKGKRSKKSKKSRKHKKKSKHYQVSESTTHSVSASPDTTTSAMTSTTEDEKHCSYWDTKFGKCRKHYKKSSSRRRKPRVIRKRVLLNIKKSCYGGKGGCYGSPRMGNFKNYQGGFPSSGNAMSAFRGALYPISFGNLPGGMSTIIPPFTLPPITLPTLPPITLPTLPPITLPTLPPITLPTLPTLPPIITLPPILPQRMLYYNSGSRPVYQAQGADNPSSNRIGSDLIPEHFPQSDVQIEGAEFL
ncbi:unnamed protein product [Gordionus sp. m RMFG-2023]